MVEGAAPAETFAISGEQIAAVGADQVAACDVAHAERHDLKGAVVLPGFIDTHSHPAAGGGEQGQVLLGEASTLEEVVAAAVTWAAAHPKAKWIEGGGWDQSKLDTVRPIAALDAAFPNTPALLYAADGHSAWANSAALRAGGLLGKDGLVPDPVGGRIDRDAQGATGALRETAADAVASAVPETRGSDWEEGVRVAMAELAKYGITGVVDADASDGALRAYRTADRANGLGADVLAAVSIEPAEGAAGVDRVARWRLKYRGQHVHVDAVKLFLDGVLEARTAAVLEAYDDGTFGEAMFSAEQLREIVARADSLDLRLHAHVIGDGAVRAFLDGLRVKTNRRTPMAAHLEMIAPSDIGRFATLGAAADIQALWAFSDAFVKDLTLPKIGVERGTRLYPFGELERAGATIVAGSDWTVTTMNPWPAIEVGVCRMDPERVAPENDGEGRNPSSGSGAAGGDSVAEEPALGVGQELSVERMLAAYTRTAASVLGLSDAGTLEAGKRANFVVVDRNPFRIPVEELSGVVVKETWFEGEKRFGGGFTR